jgi:hypothetical protein
MLAKLTAKNQLTLPKAATNAVGATEYFDVEVRDGAIVLTPVRIQRADAVRARLAELALTQTDIDDAVEWARLRVAESPTAYRTKPSKPAGKAAAAKSPGKPADKSRKAKRKP